MKILPDLITRWDELISNVILYKTHWIEIGFKYNTFVQFIKRKPELWQFIPCGKDGKPLEKPEDYDRYFKYQRACIGTEEWYNRCLEYQEAEARCLFSGFEYNGVEFGKHTIKSDNNFLLFDMDNGKCQNQLYKTIADLCNKVQLTPEGEKETRI